MACGFKHFKCAPKFSAALALFPSSVAARAASTFWARYCCRGHVGCFVSAHSSLSMHTLEPAPGPVRAMAACFKTLGLAFARSRKPRLVSRRPHAT